MRPILLLAGLVFLGPAPTAAQCLAAKPGTTFDFAPGGQSMLSTDFSGDALGEFPSNLLFLQGAMEVVEYQGQRALKASAPSALAVPLTGPLPERFTVELGVVNRNTKQVGAYTVKIYGGRRFLSDFETSSTRVEYGLIAWGVTGGGASAEAALPSDDAEPCIGQEQTVRLQVDGAKIKLYADQRRLASIPNGKFLRANGIVIALEGRDDGENAVYLTRIRIAGGGAETPVVASATPPVPVTTSAPVTGTAPAVDTGRAIAKGTPITQAPSKAPLDSTVSLSAPTGVRVELTHYKGRVLVHWDSTPGATGYSIVRWLPDGKYAGANPVETPQYGPQSREGMSIELEQGATQVGVVALYGNTLSAPSAPVSVTIPRWHGRYRVSVLGFRVDRETKDDPLETDGKRDEVYLRAAVVERGPDQQAKGGVAQYQTYVHGDVNASDWRTSTSANYRIKAGSASALGGLKTGDAFPTSTPWQRATAGNYDKTFPLQLWEGELWQGDNTVQVALQLWETDQRPGQALPSYETFSPESSSLDGAAGATQRLQPTVAGQVMIGVAAGTILAPAVAPLLLLSAPALVPTAAVILAANASGLRLPALKRVATPFDSLAPVMMHDAAATGTQNAMSSAIQAVSDGVVALVTAFEQNLQLTLNVKDRPIGIRDNGPGRVGAVPAIVTLNIENAEAEALAGNGPANLGPGVYALRFEDQLTGDGGNGIYTVYVQVERIR